MRLTRRLLLATPALLPLRAMAQDYPTKPVTLVISYPPGGIVDTVGEPRHTGWEFRDGPGQSGTWRDKWRLQAALTAMAA